jgi:hypothetical protein
VPVAVRSFVPAALLLLTLPGAALAAKGTVVDEQQRPLVDARVCYFVDRIELLCTLTDDQGHFELPVSANDTIRAHAEGYNPKIFSAVVQHGPVVLQRAPSLTVRLVDPAGEPLAGEVRISYPSGKEVGPFPINRSGLHIRRGLPPGEIRLRAVAEGFRESEPLAASLEAGEEAVVRIELRAEAEDEGAD